MKPIKLLLIVVIFVASTVVLGLTSAASANGGDQRVVKNTYLINLSRAPFTPRVGAKTSFLTSFVDLQTNRLIKDDLIINIRIAKLGGGTGSTKRTFVFEEDQKTIHGGILEFSYTFFESGLHEVFFNFAFASNPSKNYEAPDFLLDVQPESSSQNSMIAITGAAVLGAIVGLLVGLHRKTQL